MCDCCVGCVGCVEVCRASVPVEWERYAKVRSGQAGGVPGAGPGCRLWVEADVAPSRIDVAPGRSGGAVAGVVNVKSTWKST